MQPKKPIGMPQLDMFRNRLENILGSEPRTVPAGRLIDWPLLEQEFGALYSEHGRSGIPIRLMAGLSYLSHAFNTSDEATVRRWLENPYHQYFCREDFFGHLS